MKKVECAGFCFHLENGEATCVGFTKDFLMTNSVKMPALVENLPVRAIASNVFRKSRFFKLELPSTLRVIGSHAFEESSICQIWIQKDYYISPTFHSEKLLIGQGAFRGCKQLLTFTTPQKVWLSVCAFGDCASLDIYGENLEIEKMDAFAFYGCKKVSRIALSDDAELKDNCLNGSCVEQIDGSFRASIHPQVLEEIRSRKIFIWIPPNSELSDLLYEGIFVEEDADCWDLPF